MAETSARMKAALLPDRGVVKVAGEDARHFLNGLLTADILKVTPDRPCFAALLTSQGKIILDMIVAEAPAADGGGFFLDLPGALAAASVDRLNFYKLRAKVIVEDLSEMLGVLARELGISPDPPSFDHLVRAVEQRGLFPVGRAAGSVFIGEKSAKEAAIGLYDAIAKELAKNQH